jgi:hypothetical protein
MYCSASKAYFFSVQFKVCSYVYSSCTVENLVQNISLFAKEIVYVTK